MARKLQDQKRSEYQCPPKACPYPADLVKFPEIMSRVRQEWAKRLSDCRSGASKRARVQAKARWHGKRKKS